MSVRSPSARLRLRCKSHRDMNITGPEGYVHLIDFVTSAVFYQLHRIHRADSRAMGQQGATAAAVRRPLRCAAFLFSIARLTPAFERVTQRCCRITPAEVSCANPRMPSSPLLEPVLAMLGSGYTSAGCYPVVVCLLLTISLC
jgi:hypothetical protein